MKSIKERIRSAIDNHDESIWNRWKIYENKKPVIFKKDFFFEFKNDFINDLIFDGATFTAGSIDGCAFKDCYFKGATFKTGIMKSAFDNCDFSHSTFLNSNIYNVNFAKSIFSYSTFEKCTFEKIDFSSSSITNCTFNGGSISNSIVSRVNIWGNSFNSTKQNNLSIGSNTSGLNNKGYQSITVNDIELAQFFNLIMNNNKIGNFINEINSKIVLILGRFTPKRKAILDAIRKRLYEIDYSPIIFDFAKPINKDITGTVSLLANMAGLIIADLTDAKSVLWELGVILPQIPGTPVLPIILKSSDLPEMINEDLSRYNNCVLGLKIYEEKSIKNKLPEWIRAVEVKAKELKKFRLPLNRLYNPA